MKLSIIVPVYNMAADNKLNFCLDSLINQTIDDYEIIAVDDCSTDNSMQILNEYAEKYPEKFKAIHSEVNHHQGGAKNIGIKEARGEWIGFIDSDDWIVPDFYERLISKAVQTGADVVGCDYTLVYEHTFTPSKQIEANSRDNQVGELDHDKKASLILDGGSLCVKIFRRQTIIDNELWFPEDIFYEDNAMSASYLLLADRFEYIKEPLYFYYQHNASTIHSFSERRCTDRLESGRMIISEAKRHGFYEEFKDEIELKFTEMFFVNTLFTYMPCVKPIRIAYIKAMRDEMLATYPDFRKNQYYQLRIGDEEKKLIDILCKSVLGFVVYYKLLWEYRNFRKKLGI